ncbi:alcohol dehydrogenase [Cladophialophora yegresii CBS 114405]|uniref:Alcohol dehydrogenase n=1 Tax=Cladophialophora yegresii CBS 114405 TaxID=1182544 RepID=W9VLK4_9EURO|nr:alcohol dehydrogenase [Cladophialophora yegresii CBS 114405]EXJ53860.1 alcohol dehydrogenase [Cladophialophora yegresii CBS 114405]
MSQSSNQVERQVLRQDDEDMEIPIEGWAGVVKNEGSDFFVSVEKVPIPSIGPFEVLIKLNVTGLCLTDVHFMTNDWEFPKMSEMGVSCAGHEGAGVVARIGESVKNFKVGQRAAYGPIHSTCGLCDSCKTGKETYCQQAVFTGGTVDGTYKQYCAVPESFVHPIPEGVPDNVAGPAMCSAATMCSSLKESGLKAGDWAVFPGGGGGTGIQGVQLACAMGLRPVVVDKGKNRQTLALSLGAEEFVDFLKEPDPVARVLEITHGGAHGVFVSAVQSYPVSLDYLGSRRGGVVMCVGLPPKGRYHIDAAPARLCLRNQSITGTLSAGRVDIAETLEFARRGKLQLEPTVVGRSKFNEAVQRLKNGQVVGRMVVDFNLP